MIDRETEVLSKCTELLTELDDNAKFRIVKYLIERFGIIQNNTVANSRNNFANQSPQLAMNENAHLDYTEEASIKENEEYPTLEFLKLKNFPKNEPEWILCYAFYTSNYGNKTFTKNDILVKYKENGRSSESTRANLSNNIGQCIKNSWIKDTPNGEFIFLETGNLYVKEVLKGKSISKEIKRVKRTKKVKSDPDSKE